MSLIWAFITNTIYTKLYWWPWVRVVSRQLDPNIITWVKKPLGHKHRTSIAFTWHDWHHCQSACETAIMWISNVVARFSVMISSEITAWLVFRGYPSKKFVSFVLLCFNYDHWPVNFFFKTIFYFNQKQKNTSPTLQESNGHTKTK